MSVRCVTIMIGCLLRCTSICFCGLLDRRMYITYYITRCSNTPCWWDGETERICVAIKNYEKQFWLHYWYKYIHVLLMICSYLLSCGGLELGMLCCIWWTSRSSSLYLPPLFSAPCSGYHVIWSGARNSFTLFPICLLNSKLVEKGIRTISNNKEHGILNS